MPRKSETKHALSGTEDGCGGGRGWEGKREGKEGREDGRERDGRRMGGDGAGREDGGERDGRRMGGDGKMEGSETVGTELGREDGGERDGRAWVVTGLGREDGGERDGRRRPGYQKENKYIYIIYISKKKMSISYQKEIIYIKNKISLTKSCACHCKPPWQRCAM